jgi:hypothetical protein
LCLSKLAARMVTSTSSENLFYQRYELQNQNFYFETTKTLILHTWSIFFKGAHLAKLWSKKIFFMKSLSKLGALTVYIYTHVMLAYVIHWYTRDACICVFYLMKVRLKCNCNLICMCTFIRALNGMNIGVKLQLTTQYNQPLTLIHKQVRARHISSKKALWSPKCHLRSYFNMKYTTYVNTN